MVQLTIDFTDNQHEKIQEMTGLSGTVLRDYVIRKILEMLQKDWYVYKRNQLKASMDNLYEGEEDES